MKSHLLLIKRQKYKIVLVMFLLWMLFFDDYNLFFVYKSYKKLEEIKCQQIDLLESINKVKEDIYKLNNDKSAIEKYSRENFFMIKPNEDLFIVIEE